MIPKVLTVAGSDSSGGAGVQADLKTFSAHGCYGMSVFSALTAQNTLGVQAVHAVPTDFFVQQLKSVFDDVPPDAVKTGMLPNAISVMSLAVLLKEKKAKNIVVDPVMVSTSGDRLVNKNAINALKTNLIPMADLITPNGPEAEILLGYQIVDPIKAIENLLELGCKGVLLKGGHGDSPDCVDFYGHAGGIDIFEAPRHPTENTHGTGCTLSSAIAANLAKGLAMREAIGEAKSYITEAIKHADKLEVGEGAGPVHHFWNTWET